MTDNLSKVSRWVGIAVLIVGVGIVLLAWDRFGFGEASSLAGGNGLIDQTLGAPSEWRHETETDPMTDEEIISASRQIEADGFLIDAVISCRPATGVLSYRFTTFDATGTPAGATEKMTYGTPVPYHEARIRIGDEGPTYLEDRNPRYANAFEFASNDPWPAFRDEMAFADRLTVKLQLLNGEPILVLDQSGPPLSTVIGPCIADPSPLASRRQSEAPVSREPQLHRFTISEDFAVTDASGDVVSSLGIGGIGTEQIPGFCVGDEIALANATGAPIRLTAGIYESDDFTPLGTVQPGSELKYRAEGAADILLSSPDHPSFRLRYRVSDCGR